MNKRVTRHDFKIFIDNDIETALYLHLMFALHHFFRFSCPSAIRSIPLDSSSPSSASPTASAGTTAAFRWWTLRPQCLDPLGAAGREVGVGIEIRAIKILVVVGDGESGANGQPAWTDGRVAPKNVQSSATCIAIGGGAQVQQQVVLITQVVTCQCSLNRLVEESVQ